MKKFIYRILVLLFAILFNESFANEKEKFIMDVKYIDILKEMMSRDDNFDENGELTQEAKDYIEKRRNE